MLRSEVQNKAKIYISRSIKQKRETSKEMLTCKGTCNRIKVSVKGAKYGNGLKYCTICDIYTDKCKDILRCPCCNGIFRVSSLHTPRRLQDMIKRNKEDYKQVQPIKYERIRSRSTIK